jgi:hypothetical protein
MLNVTSKRNSAQTPACISQAQAVSAVISGVKRVVDFRLIGSGIFNRATGTRNLSQSSGSHVSRPSQTRRDNAKETYQPLTENVVCVRSVADETSCTL